MALEGHRGDGLVVQLWELQRIDGAEHRLLQLLAAGSDGQVRGGYATSKVAGSGGGSHVAAVAAQQQRQVPCLINCAALHLPSSSTAAAAAPLCTHRVTPMSAVTRFSKMGCTNS